MSQGVPSFFLIVNLIVMRSPAWKVPPLAPESCSTVSTTPGGSSSGLRFGLVGPESPGGPGGPCEPVSPLQPTIRALAINSTSTGRPIPDGRWDSSKVIMVASLSRRRGTAQNRAAEDENCALE